MRQAYVGVWLARQWAEVAGAFGVAGVAQMVKPISGPEGWLQYVAKHGARGAGHYQRSGTVPGWGSMPQMWSKSRGWPVSRMDADVDMATYWRARRLTRSWLAAQRASDLRRAERSGDPAAVARARRSLSYVRGMLRCNDRALSSVLGLRDWCPQDVGLALASAAGWSGELKEGVT